MPDQLHDAKIFVNKFRYNADKISKCENIDPDLYNEISNNLYQDNLLFEKAKTYEKHDFTWRDDGKLDDVVLKEVQKATSEKPSNSSPLLVDILSDDENEMVYEKPCLICHL